MDIFQNLIEFNFVFQQKRSSDECTCHVGSWSGIEADSCPRNSLCPNGYGQLSQAIDSGCEFGDCIGECKTDGVTSYHCCHSCPTPPPPPSSSGGGCFPSSATVSIENGKSISMSNLQVGDRVQTGIHILL